MTSVLLQLKTTNVHIHNIFNVPQAVAETRELIKEQKLLEAHRKCVHTMQPLSLSPSLSLSIYISPSLSLVRSLSLSPSLPPSLSPSSPLSPTLPLSLPHTHTHCSLSELEHTRDELLMQLYQGEDAYVDKNTVSSLTFSFAVCVCV